MLTAADRAELRKLMEEEIRALEQTLASLEKSEESISPDAAVGRLSRMDSMVNKGTMELAMAESQQRLRRLREKLARIDEPDFGKCPMCSEWISMDRLRAAPDRGVCVSCLNKAKPVKKAG
jgi:DnaK suppressor protein